MGKGFFVFLKVSICGVFLAILAGSCGGNEKTFTIEGTLDNAGLVQTVVLQEGDRTLDSVFLTENGRFRLRRTASQPRLFTLRAGGHRFPVILQNGDHVTFRADLSAADGQYTVSGSPLS